MISNISVLSLNNEYAKHIGKKLAKDLEMFYADVVDLLTFDFIDLSMVKKTAGIEFLRNKEKKKIKTVCSYENSVITLDYRSLNDVQNYNNLHGGSVICYLKLSQNCLKKSYNGFKMLKKFDYNLQKEREQLLLKKADIIVEVNELNDKKIINNIKNSIEVYYENR